MPLAVQRNFVAHGAALGVSEAQGPGPLSEGGRHPRGTPRWRAAGDGPVGGFRTAGATRRTARGSPAGLSSASGPLPGEEEPSCVNSPARLLTQPASARAHCAGRAAASPASGSGLCTPGTKRPLWPAGGGLAAGRRRVMPPVPWSRGDEGQLEARDPESSLESKRGGQGYSRGG